MLHQVLGFDSGAPLDAIPAIGCGRSASQQHSEGVPRSNLGTQHPCGLPCSPEISRRPQTGRPGKLQRSSSPHQLQQQCQLLPPPRGQQRRLPGCRPAAVPAVTLLTMKIPRSWATIAAVILDQDACGAHTARVAMRIPAVLTLLSAWSEAAALTWAASLAAASLRVNRDGCGFPAGASARALSTSLRITSDILLSSIASAVDAPSHWLIITCSMPRSQFMSQTAGSIPQNHARHSRPPRPAASNC